MCQAIFSLPVWAWKLVCINVITETECLLHRMATQLFFRSPTPVALSQEQIFLPQLRLYGAFCW